jgi:hypothetical protein
VRGRAFERFDQRQIAVPETKGGSKPAVDASFTLKSTMFSPKLTPGSGHENWVPAGEPERRLSVK